MLARRTRLLGGLAVLATGAVLVSGCGSSDDDSTASTPAATSTGASTATTATATTTAAAKPVNVAYLAYTKTDFTDAQVKGIDEAVQAGGGSVKELISNFDPAKQVAQCKDAITTGRFDAIVIVPLEPATPVACVTAAKAAGIPVATIETAVGKDPFALEPQVDGVVSVVASPVETEVDADAEMIEAACGDADPCQVAAEVASANDPFTNLSVDGVEKKLSPRVKVVQKIVTHYDPGEMTRQLPDVLTANPDLNVVYSASDQSALAAVPVLKAAGKTDQVKIIGRGGSSEGAAAVKAGTLFGTTGNWPVQYGRFVGEALTQAVNGQPVENVSLDILKADTPTVVTQDTVDSFTPEWGSAQ